MGEDLLGKVELAEEEAILAAVAVVVVVVQVPAAEAEAVLTTLA